MTLAWWQEIDPFACDDADTESTMHPFVMPTHREMDQKFMKEFVEIEDDAVNERIDRLKENLEGATVIKCATTRRIDHAPPATPHNDKEMYEADQDREGVGVQGDGQGTCGVEAGICCGGGTCPRWGCDPLLQKNLLARMERLEQACGTEVAFKGRLILLKRSSMRQVTTLNITSKH
ncbi:uncharacterized protein LOC132623367 [Lycium barbarum]|uniref:uncharacterized protein LOC132623367 n=1 Tax=Lycium barbarum TaxID=112863 RepID=UPI00293EF2F4|nr:uncharacterized protein LOC132623367 [Lycium barbarum]